MGYPWATANERPRLRDIPDLLTLNWGWFRGADRPVDTSFPYYALMDASLAGIWASGTVQGPWSCFSILINPVGSDRPRGYSRATHPFGVALL